MPDCRDNCEIPDGGFCPRHKIKKPYPWVQLCLKKYIYWRAWEEGRGPGQITAGSKEYMRRQVNHRVVGVGTYLTRWFSSIGVRAHAGCHCKSIATEMDRVGIDAVEDRLEEYTNRMYDSAREWRKGKEYFPQPPRFAVKMLIKWAIKCARNGASDNFTLPEEESDTTQESDYGTGIEE